FFPFHWQIFVIAASERTRCPGRNPGQQHAIEFNPHRQTDQDISSLLQSHGSPPATSQGEESTGASGEAITGLSGRSTSREKSPRFSTKPQAPRLLIALNRKYYRQQYN